MPKPKRRVSRRSLLQWGLAAAGSSILRSCKSVTGEKKENKTISRPTISTKGIGVKGVIERTPKIAELEMSWYKPGTGKLCESNEKRKINTILTEFPEKGDRSALHTHPYSLPNNPPDRIRNLINSTLSPWDILIMLERAQYKKSQQMFVSHVAPIDSKGKVLGYCSWRISKKLIKNKEALTRLEEVAGIQILHWGKYMKEKNWNGLENSIMEYHNEIKSRFGPNGTIVQNGLFIHYTPMPGYEYRNSAFQKKK